MRVCSLQTHTHTHTQSRRSRHSLGSRWSPSGCSEGGKQAVAAAAAAAAAVAVVAAAAAVGAVGSGPLHAGTAGRADRVGAALLACCWYPKQLPTQDKGASRSHYRLTTTWKQTWDLKWIHSDCCVITQQHSPHQSSARNNRTSVLGFFFFNRRNFFLAVGPSFTSLYTSDCWRCFFLDLAPVSVILTAVVLTSRAAEKLQMSEAPNNNSSTRVSTHNSILMLNKKEHITKVGCSFVVHKTFIELHRKNIHH